MAAGLFPSPTRAHSNPRSFPRLPSSFSHGSSSFPLGHADQGGSAAAVSPRPGGGYGGSRGGAGWPILESWHQGVSGGGGGVDEAPWALRTCRVCSRSFNGPEALYLHMKICRPAPAAAVEPPALLLQQLREMRPSMASWTRPREPAWVARVLEVFRSLFPWFREEFLGLFLGMPCLAIFVDAAEKVVADERERAVYRARVYVKSAVEARIPQVKPTVAIAPAPRAAAPATLAPAPFIPAAAAPPMPYAAHLATLAAFVTEPKYACKLCGKTFNSGQALGGHIAGGHRRATAPSLAHVPAPAASTSSFPPGIATRKRPAMEAAASPGNGNGKRRCIRLFGVDIAEE